MCVKIISCQNEEKLVLLCKREKLPSPMTCSDYVDSIMLDSSTPPRIYVSCNYQDDRLHSAQSRCSTETYHVK